MDWNGEVVWRKYMFAHHELTTAPHGRLLTLLVHRRQVPQVDATIETRDDEIAILSADGEVLQTVSVLESWSTSPTKPKFYRVVPNERGGQVAIELFHCNSVEWMPHKHLIGTSPLYGRNNVLACSRHQNRVFMIDMARGTAIWIWGEGELSGPHDAQVVANGNVLVFDNGVEREWSRVVEVDPAAGDIVWEYAAPKRAGFYTKSKGSAQRLANGNTLIANSDHGEVFEVTRAGDVVWRYLVPIKNERGGRAAVVRAIRHEPARIEGLLQKWGGKPE